MKPILVMAFVAAMIVPPAGSGAGVQALSSDAPLTLWYRQPAAEWVEALPIGNGRLAVVMAATAIAAYQPARRATRVDPAQALRTDG